MGAYHSTKHFWALKTSINGRKISLIKTCFKNPKNCKFPKSDSFNRNFRNGNKIGRKFPVNVLKVGIPFEFVTGNFQ